ncbi:hypothetical protein D3C72_1416990 [compost metagenome]
MDLANATQVVVAQMRAGDFGRAQERQRQAPGDGFAFGIRQRQQQTLGIQLPVIQPQHTTERVSAQAAHQRRGQFDPRAGIVVAGDHHDGQQRLLFVGADDEVVETLLGFDRRIDRVEDIAGDQQHIRLVELQLTQQPLEKTAVFEIAILAVQVLPEVPVGGVKQAQGELRYKIGNGRVKNEGGERGKSLLANGRECRRQKKQPATAPTEYAHIQCRNCRGCAHSNLLLVEGRALSRYIGLRDVWC